MGGIEHQHHVVRRLGIEAAEHAADLGQLVHQLALVLQASGGVDDQRVDALIGRGLDRVEHDRSRIPALGALDAGDTEPVGPYRKRSEKRRVGNWCVSTGHSWWRSLY